MPCEKKREVKDISKDFAMEGEEFLSAKMWKSAGFLGKVEFSFEHAIFERAHYSFLSWIMAS